MAGKKIPSKWESEQKAIKAIQVAFDLDEKVQYVIRREALDADLNPTERMRQILGLALHAAPKRPRLSISLRPKDFDVLAERYKVDPGDRKAIKQHATAELRKYAEGKKLSKDE